MAPTDHPGCPTVEKLAELVSGDLEPQREQELTAHLDQCSRCRQRLDAVAAGGDLVAALGRTDLQPVIRSQPLDTAIDLLKATPPTGSAAGPGDDQPYADLLPWLEPAPRGIGRVGDYLLTRFLGRGGMGLVFAGREAALDRAVAIKFLSPALAAEAAFRDRFTREARVAAAVNHPHVVTVLAVGEVQGLPYLVMERVEGESLDGLLAGGRDRAVLPLSSSRVAEIGRQVAAGLQAAHTAGLVHRDVKPANILVSADGATVKLTDFGLAHPLTEATADTLAGTPGSISPEVLAGEKPSPRSDLFGLGCVLYQLIAGHPPSGPDTGEPPDAAGAEPLANVAPATPPWLAAIVDRLLATDPAARFQSAAAVVAALADGMQTADAAVPVMAIPAVRPRLSPTLRQRLTLAGLIVGAAVIVGVVSFGLSSQPGSLDAASLAAALEAANSGETIVVSGGSFELAGLDLGDRDLVIRGEGPRPVLRFVAGGAVAGQTLIRTGGDLVLAGLSLELVVGPEAPDDVARSLIELDGGSLRLEDCTLEVAGESNCVIARDTPQIEIVDSSLHAPRGTVIDWTPAAGGVASAERTIMTGRTAWAVADPVDATLDLERVTGVVDRLVSLRWDELDTPADGRLEMAATASVVAADEALLLLHAEALPQVEFEAAVSFRGRHNLLEGTPVLLDRDAGLQLPSWLAAADAPEPANLTSEDSVFADVEFVGSRVQLRDWPESAAGEVDEAFAVEPDADLRQHFGGDPPGAVEGW